MSKEYKKCYYVVATVNDKSYYVEGDFTQEEIDNLINNFNIDEFLADEAVDEEYDAQTDNNEYAIYRQSMLSTEELLDKNFATIDADNVVTFYHAGLSVEKQKEYEQRKNEIEQEVFAAFGENSLVCRKSFA